MTTARRRSSANAGPHHRRLGRSDGQQGSAHLALQMREQHIKRERATSNICTASALIGLDDGLLPSTTVPEGLKRAAETAHFAAATVPPRAGSDGLRNSSEGFFRHAGGRGRGRCRAVAGARTGINLSTTLRRIGLDVVRPGDHPAEIEAARNLRRGLQGGSGPRRSTGRCREIPAAPAARVGATSGSRFNAYRSKRPDALHQKLELRDISLANSMISLGPAP